MLPINAESFYSAISNIRRVQAQWEREHALTPSFRITEKHKAGIRKHVEALQDALAKLDARGSVEIIGMILADLEGKRATYGVFVFHVHNLDRMLRGELSGAKIFALSPGDIALLEPPSAPFGEAVLKAFPSAESEIDEAGKCLALSRYSATVYHLMRCLEVGLRSLADALDVTPSNPNWETVINEIEKAVGGMSKLTHEPDWKSLSQFYSEAAAHFRLLKNAWRNYAMHLHARYDEERAREIYDSVRAFMRHLSTGLREHNQPPGDTLPEPPIS